MIEVTKQAFARSINWALLQLTVIEVKHVKLQVYARWDKVKQKYSAKLQAEIGEQILAANHHLDEADRHIQLAIKQYQIINQTKKPR